LANDQDGHDERTMDFHRRLTAAVLLAFMLVGSIAHGQDQQRPPLPSSAGDATSAIEQVSTIFIAVPAAKFPATQRQLAAVFRDRLKPSASGDRSSWSLSVRGTTTSMLQFRFDRQRNGIHVTGPQRLTVQFSKLVNKLSETTRAGYRTQVFRLQRENHSSLRRAVKSIGDEKPKPLGAASPVDQSRYVVPAGSLGAVRQTAFQNPVDPESNDARQADGQEEKRTPARVRQFDGVEIESLPDLDVIIL